MKTLFLARHAKSSWKDPTLDDIDRPLSGRGKDDAPRIGAWLASEGHVPELILSSPAKRARKTAKRLAKALELESERIEIEAGIYSFDSGGEVIAAIERVDDGVEALMVVGHNPTFTMLANRLAGLELDNLPTCGVVGVRFAVDRWREIAAAEGERLFLIVPKELRPS